jgi:hypothetical protein
VDTKCLIVGYWFVFDCGLLDPADTRTQWCWVLLNPLELGPAPSRTQKLGALPSLLKAYGSDLAADPTLKPDPKHFQKLPKRWVLPPNNINFLNL